MAAVDRALASPGRGSRSPVDSERSSTARITADCLAGGYLRVEVRQDETPLYVGEKRYLKTPGPVATQVEHDHKGWLVRIRAS